MPTLSIPLGPTLTAEQAERIYNQGQEAVVFALLELAKMLAEKSVAVSASASPTTPSGMKPPYEKPTAKSRRKRPGCKEGHPGSRRPPPEGVNQREEHRLKRCPECGGPLKRCHRTRTRYIEDIPADIEPMVTEHTIHRDWCPRCKKSVEPVVPDALPGSTLGNRVLVLAAWLHYALGNTLSQIVEVFNYHLQMKLTPGALTQQWQRLRTILEPWYEEIRGQALRSAVLHADETSWRVNGKTHWLWCFATDELTYFMIDRCRGSPALLKFFSEEFRGTLVTDFWGAYNKVVCAAADVLGAFVARLPHGGEVQESRPALAGVRKTDATIDPRCHAAEQARRPVGRRVRLASVAVGRAVADDDRRGVGRFPGETAGQATAASSAGFVHVPRSPRRSFRQQPRRAEHSPGGYHSQEQLLQPQPQRSSRPSRPYEHLPKPETTRP